MVIRLMLAMLGIALGLAAIFATDWVWLLVQQVNATFGRDVQRTDRWNARAPFAGMILVGAGIVLLVTGLMRM